MVPKISIVIPAYNEEKRIRPTIEAIAGFLRKQKIGFELIVVFDGTDGTPRVVKDFAGANAMEKQTKVLVFPRRLGKGGAVSKGFAAARGEVVFLVDADGSTPPKEIPKLLDALKNCDIAVGSRYLSASKADIPFGRRMFSFVFHLLVQVLFGLGIRDTQCGFKAFRLGAVKKILPCVKTTNFVWDVDALYHAKKFGLRVQEIPIEWHVKSGGTITSLNGIQTAFKMFSTLLKLRFS